MATFLAAVQVFILFILVSVCRAGEYCSYYTYSSYGSSSGISYCPYGCCGYNNGDCCSAPIGLIVGLCVGGAVFIFFVILTICLCRRRRFAGVVYRNQQSTPAVVVQQSTMSSQNGVATAGVQPGVTYPPYPQYQYPPVAYPTAPGYSVAPTGYPQVPHQAGVGYPPQQPGVFAEPPKYDALNFESNGGITNPGFDVKH